MLDHARFLAAGAAAVAAAAAPADLEHLHGPDNWSAPAQVFGNVSARSRLDRAAVSHGLPNGYILGEEAPAHSSPDCAGEGALHQMPAISESTGGPSVGFDGAATRTP